MNPDPLNLCDLEEGDRLQLLGDPDPDLFLTSSTLLAVFRGEAGPLPELRRWLDGPGLAVFIRQEFSDLSAQLATDLKRVQKWAEGIPAEEATAERLLVHLGGQLVDLPGELWIDKPERRPRRKTESTEELPLGSKTLTVAA